MRLVPPIRSPPPEYARIQSQGTMPSCATTEQSSPTTGATRALPTRLMTSPTRPWPLASSLDVIRAAAVAWDAARTNLDLRDLHVGWTGACSSPRGTTCSVATHAVGVWRRLVLEVACFLGHCVRRVAMLADGRVGAGVADDHAVRVIGTWTALGLTTSVEQTLLSEAPRASNQQQSDETDRRLNSHACPPGGRADRRHRAPFQGE